MSKSALRLRELNPGLKFWIVERSNGFIEAIDVFTSRISPARMPIRIVVQANTSREAIRLYRRFRVALDLEERWAVNYQNALNNWAKKASKGVWLRPSEAPVLKPPTAVRENPRQKATGDCFEASGKYIMDVCLMEPDCQIKLVHGEVAGQGKLKGTRFGHAWILDGNLVIDVSGGKNMVLPKSLYYAVGGIDEINNFHEYTWQEANKKIMKHKHWGPWDLKTSTGL